MTEELQMQRRDLIMRLPLFALAGGIAVPAIAAELRTTVLNMASAATAAGNPPAVGLIQIADGRLGEPFVTGVKAADGAERAGANGRWHIGSNAKSMTATMIARLVERDILAWDAPLSELLPGLDMQPAYRKATLPDLLSHRAGFARNSAAGLARMPDNDPRSSGERRCDYIAAALKEPPIGPIGAGPGSYSNTGFVVAGLIAERATGLPFETLMRSEVFEPLGLSSVGFGGTPEGEIAGHSKGRPVYDEAGDNPDFLRPAGGLYLSLADWGGYVLDQMKGQRGDGRLLSVASYAFLHAAQPGSDNGLGWGVEPAPNGKPMWSHDGSNGRWFAIAAVLPDDRRAVMVAANAAGEEVERMVNRLVVQILGLAKA